MDTIRIYDRKEDGYKRLEKVAAILTAGSPTGTKFTVGETYFDFGQDWKWTTILAESPRYGSYQALNPRDHEDIMIAENLFDIAARITHGKFWLDKKEEGDK